MKSRLSCLFVLSVAVSVFAGCAAKSTHVATGGCDKPCVKPTADQTAKWAKFGEPMKLAAAETTCAKTVLADPDRYAGKFVRLSGEIESVCAHKGCWIRLAGPTKGETLFVKFTCPVSGRLVPMEAVGHRAIVEGTFEVTEVSQDEARHYAEDRKATPEEIAKIVGPQKEITLKSPAALVEGVDASVVQKG